MIEQEYYTQEQVKLISDVRTAWIEHNSWLRSLIVSMVDGLEDSEYIKYRLLNKPLDIVTVLRPYIEEEKADYLEDMILNQISILIGLITAIKEGDSLEEYKNKVKWDDFVDEFGAFWETFDPEWNQTEGQELLYDYYKMFVVGIVKRINGFYEEDVMLVDLVNKKSIEIADFISEVIIEEFMI